MHKLGLARPEKELLPQTGTRETRLEQVYRAYSNATGESHPPSQVSASTGSLEAHPSWCTSKQLKPFSSSEGNGFFVPIYEKNCLIQSKMPSKLTAETATTTISNHRTKLTPRSTAIRAAAHAPNELPTASRNPMPHNT